MKLVSIAAVILAVVHMLVPESMLRIDTTTILLLVIAGLPWLFPWLKSIKLPGGIELVLREMQEKLEKTEQVAKRAEDAAILGVRPGEPPSPSRAASMAQTTASEPAWGTDAEDPWKGQFGQKSERDERRLRAAVAAIPERPGWFSVRLVVESTSPKTKPLTRSVRFFLHPTFANHKADVPVGPLGRAELSLVSYGHFTVGALADEGKTSLELDLAELPGVPAEFLEH